MHFILFIKKGYLRAGPYFYTTGLADTVVYLQVEPVAVAKP